MTTATLFLRLFLLNLVIPHAKCSKDFTKFCQDSVTCANLRLCCKGICQEHNIGDAVTICRTLRWKPLDWTKTFCICGREDSSGQGSNSNSPQKNQNRGQFANYEPVTVKSIVPVPNSTTVRSVLNYTIPYNSYNPSNGSNRVANSEPQIKKSQENSPKSSYRLAPDPGDYFEENPIPPQKPKLIKEPYRSRQYGNPTVPRTVKYSNHTVPKPVEYINPTIQKTVQQNISTTVTRTVPQYSNPQVPKSVQYRNLSVPRTVQVRNPTLPRTRPIQFQNRGTSVEGTQNQLLPKPKEATSPNQNLPQGKNEKIGIIEESDYFDEPPIHRNPSYSNPTQTIADSNSGDLDYNYYQSEFYAPNYLLPDIKQTKFAQNTYDNKNFFQNHPYKGTAQLSYLHKFCLLLSMSVIVASIVS